MRKKFMAVNIVEAKRFLEIINAYTTAAHAAGPRSLLTTGIFIQETGNDITYSFRILLKAKFSQFNLFNFYK